MKKVLIVGVNGMLGLELQRALKDKFQCIGTTIQELDITNYDQTILTIKKNKPHIVINVAGLTMVDLCEEKRGEAFAVNAEGAKHIAMGCQEIGAKCLYFSTDYVFDGGKREPYSEEDLPNPLSVYGKSKLQGEEYVREILDDFLIIRTSWLFSQEGSNFVKTIITISQESDALDMVNDQEGSPTYAKDLCSAILFLMEKDLKGIFHISNKGSCTWREFAQKILELIGSRLKLIPITSAQCGRPAPRPHYSVLSTEKFERLTGFVMPHWEDALARCLKTMDL